LRETTRFLPMVGELEVERLVGLSRELRTPFER